MPSRPPRTVLFLQGPPTRFWPELARAFEAAGHRTRAIRLNGGDLLFGAGGPSVSYRGRLSAWPAWLTAYCRREGVTDILYYADRQPYHVAARRVAEGLGIRPYALEFGYLRPHWLTLERGGMGAYSHFPDDPALIRAAAEGLPAPQAEPFGFSFTAEATHEVVNGLTMEALRVLYPFYRSDRYYHPWFDYSVWLKRLLVRGGGEPHALATMARLWDAGTAYNTVALQLQSDYQIRANSPYRHIREMIDQVIASFARAADPDRHLVFKQHPLDNGWENWPKVIAATAARHGVTDRVVAVDGGPLMEILTRSKGAIVINSTVGLHAVQAGVPTKILGVAVFDVPGITHQGRLDGFWSAPEPVDIGLVDCMVRLMAATIQVPGSFYNPAGRRAAAAEIVRRVALQTVNEPGGFVAVPPRLARAKAMGVDVGGDLDLRPVREACLETGAAYRHARSP